jgi:hypothetical protein
MVSVSGDGRRVALAMDTGDLVIVGLEDWVLSQQQVGNWKRPA